MKRSETLELFLLGYDQEIRCNGEGRASAFIPLWEAAKKKYENCEMQDLLDALYSLQPDHAELIKWINPGAPEGMQRVVFDRNPATGRWQDFFLTYQFKIKTLPAGKIRFDALTEKLESQNASKTESDDRKFARMAIDLARKSISEDDGRPHPFVGAVVVKNGKVLSTAHRGEAAGNHAEFIALEKKLSDEAVAGATVYTTLEPCASRNPPKIACADRLVERKVIRVVVGMLDPDKTVRGLGLQKLRSASIHLGWFDPDMMSECEEMNRDFIRSREAPKNGTES